MAEDLKAVHPIRLNESASFSVNDDGRSVAEIKTFIQMLNPAIIQRAAASYLAASDKLLSMCQTLSSGSTAMATVWEGPSSVEAQQSLRTLYATIRELALKFEAVGLPLEGLGRRLLEHQDFVENKSGAWSDNTYTFDDSMAKRVQTMDKGVEHGSQDEMAGQHLRLLNDDLRNVYVQWPVGVYKVVPDIKPPALPDPDLTAPPGPGDYRVDPIVLNGPGSEYQSPGIDDIGATPTIGSDPAGLPQGTLNPDGTYRNESLDPSTIGADGRYPDGTYPNDGDPGTGDLNGTTPNGVNPTGAYPNGVNPNLTANAGVPDTSGPNTPDSRTTLEDFQRPAGWDPSISTSAQNSGSPYSMPGTGPGTGSGGAMIGSGGLPLNARSASVTGSGMPFLPMGGAGAGANESEDKENSTWLHEDDDVWGTDTEGAVSDKIG
ncbi:hypothetical protein GCM10022419_121230 [Nonomuraea rosea]|uniref:WXG100 family type VII secretion target n=1 Tax=Nonomuraea rosea TaxID=638574 RepID=A0ABP6ZUQ7_9ACTN